MYASPSFCKAPVSLFYKLLAFEPRVCRIVNIESNTLPSITCVSDNVCKKLFSQVVSHADHPLHVLFDNKKRRKTRSKNTFRSPLCETKRLSNSFINA